MEISFLIVGTPRSGTTLVQRLACELPGVSMSRETHFFSSGYAAGLVRRGGFPLDDERLDEELAAYRTAYEARTSNRLPLDNAGVSSLLGQTCDRPISLFAAIVRSLAAPDRIIGEKTPDHIRWWRPISRAMPEAKFIFVVRDPRAVVESTLRMPWGSRSHVAIAERWSRDQRATMGAHADLGDDRCLFLRYEDVVHDPLKHQQVLVDLLGAEGITPGADNRADSLASVVIASRSWKEKALGPITTDDVDGWREGLSRDRCLDVAAICRDQMERFGYDQRSDGPDGADRRRSHLRIDRPIRRARVRRATGKRQRAIDAIAL